MAHSHAPLHTLAYRMIDSVESTHCNIGVTTHYAHTPTPI